MTLFVIFLLFRFYVINNSSFSGLNVTSMPFLVTLLVVPIAFGLLLPTVLSPIHSVG